MRRATGITIAVAILLAPLAAAAQQIDPHNPTAAVEAAREKCLDEHRGEDLGPLTVDTLCELRGWALLGRHYPTLAERALEAEERANANASKINELRSQLRRERQQTDELASKLGKREAQIERSSPTWLVYVASAGALIVGGAAGYGVGRLMP